METSDKFNYIQKDGIDENNSTIKTEATLSIEKQKIQNLNNLISCNFDKQTIPTEPDTECDPELQEKIIKWINLKKEKGISLNDTLSNSKAFKNPSIVDKLIGFLNLNEYGSNYEKSIFDPNGFSEDSYYDKLAEAQERERELPATVNASKFVSTGTKYN
ncbi:SAP30-binding protein [Clydaea vesicula]|uniref:SAP30-binding protein n=1 Tax=Clydaea vesicula TaxID=447962 RepID=A0AAD5U6G6_9FUNG|nr:SAP30-binding protein [Clydaea vesicula]